MSISELINLALAGLIFGWVLQPKIKEIWNKAKAQLTQTKQPPLVEKVGFMLSRYHSAQEESHERNHAELNHIKGQLQEVLQMLKAPQTNSVPRDPIVAEISGDVKVLYDRLNHIAKQVSEVQGSAEYVESAVKSESERNSAKLYSEGLASLANASNATLERVVSIEKLLGDTVNVLNVLTQRLQ